MKINEVRYRFCGGNGSCKSPKKKKNQPRGGIHIPYYPKDGLSRALRGGTPLEPSAVTAELTALSKTVLDFFKPQPEGGVRNH